MFKSESHLRSLVKGLSWRVTGTLDTIAIALLVTHDFSTALKIGAVEVVTKILLYYGHERVWQKIGWGRSTASSALSAPDAPSDVPLRSAAKGVSWRATATLDTMLIAYFITHDISKALAIGGIEIFTKLMLYYGHERVWQKIGWGRPRQADASPSANAPLAA